MAVQIQYYSSHLVPSSVLSSNTFSSNAFFPCLPYFQKHKPSRLCLVFTQLQVSFFFFSFKVRTKSFLCLNLRGWIGRIYYLKANGAFFFLMAKDLKSET